MMILFFMDSSSIFPLQHFFYKINRIFQNIYAPFFGSCLRMHVLVIVCFNGIPIELYSK